MYIVVFLLILFAILIRYILYLYKRDPIIENQFELFQNDSPVIAPPTEIIIEGNQHECHKTLTPCTTHMDCDLCREGLANCQYFDEKTLVKIVDPETNDEIEFEIQPGESYCLALDRQRARSCNPNTGLWLLTKSENGFSLLCNCLTPGLVTQFNLYEDCNVSIGCQPNGFIRNINESPMQCQCNEGYISDYDDLTQTPLCRPETVRDVMYDTNFFERAPCSDGFVRVDHPALREEYRQIFILPDICVPDPCSIDPITGLRTSGRLVQLTERDQTFNYCQCPIEKNLFSVYSPQSMIKNSFELMSNACIMPFNTNIDNIGTIYYKNFWGRNFTSSSDDDVYAYTMKRFVYPKYHSIVYDIQNTSIIKFSTCYTPYTISNVILPHDRNLFQKYLA